MKKYLLFFGAIVLFSATLLISSCSSDTTTPVEPPSISFVAGAGYISSNSTVTVSTPFVVKILAEANVTSGSKIASVKITRIINNQTVGDTTFSFNNATVTLEITFISYSLADVENIEFKATDKDGQSKTISLQITTVLVTTSINSFPMKILGSYDSQTGSSFASIDGSVYTLAEAFAHQAAVDFLYWWGSQTNATIGAPDDPNANAVYTGVNGLPNWTTKNATRFVATMVTVAEFDAINDGNVLATLAAGATTKTRMEDLSADNVFGFKTQSGKYGLIKVININGGAAGDITFDVKVQQ